MPCDCKDGEFWVQTELWSPLSVELTTPSSSNGRELSRVGERLGGLMGDVVLDEGLLHGVSVTTRSLSAPTFLGFWPWGLAWPPAIISHSWSQWATADRHRHTHKCLGVSRAPSSVALLQQCCWWSELWLLPSFQRWLNL